MAMRPFDQLTPRGRAARLARLAQRAAAEFGLEPARVGLVIDGYNTTYRIDDLEGGRWAMRISRRGPTAAHVEGELDWLAALRRDTDLIVPAPALTPDGRRLVTVEVPGVPTPRHCALFPWLSGRTFSKRWGAGKFRSLGRAMATLHAHAAGWTPPAGAVRPRFDALWWEGAPDLGALSPTQRSVFEAAAARLEPVIVDLARRPAQTLLHADLHQWNVRFRPRDQVELLDFDDCGVGHPVFDVGIARYYLRRLGGFSQHAAALEAGYREVRAWPEPAPGVVEAVTAHRVLILYASLMSHENPALLESVRGVFEAWTALLTRWLKTGRCVD